LPSFAVVISYPKVAERRWWESEVDWADRTAKNIRPVHAEFRDQMMSHFPALLHQPVTSLQAHKKRRVDMGRQGGRQPPLLALMDAAGNEHLCPPLGIASVDDILALLRTLHSARVASGGGGGDSGSNDGGGSSSSATVKSEGGSSSIAPKSEEDAPPSLFPEQLYPFASVTHAHVRAVGNARYVDEVVVQFHCKFRVVWLPAFLHFLSYPSFLPFFRNLTSGALLP
jgi:hypothetical protein